MWSPRFECVVGGGGGASYCVGHEQVDEFLEFIAARARPNTVKAYAHDLKIFFTVVAKEPAEVTSRDVLGFITQQRQGRSGAENVVRITDGSAGLSAATIKRRLAAVSALYGYLVVRGDAGVTVNPVPHGLPTRQRRRNGPKVVPLVRWQASYTDERTGKRLSAPDTFASKTDANLWLFKDWADEWLCGLHVKPKTLVSYESSLRNHVLPVFVDRPVGTITYRDAKGLVADPTDLLPVVRTVLVRRSCRSGWCRVAGSVVGGAEVAEAECLRVGQFQRSVHGPGHDDRRC